jgi:hypothetical protein
MSLREIQSDSTKVTVYVVEEPAPKSAMDASQNEQPNMASLNVAQALGLADPDMDLKRNCRAYRALGFSPQSLWCNSTRIIALDPRLVTAIDPTTTNCPSITGMGVAKIDVNVPVPLVTLDYADSLLNYLEDEDGSLQIRDKPTLDVRLEEVWCDDARCYARVWLKGSYKGKSKSATVTFSYDPLQNKVCVGHGTYKNDYIRIKDIETCWYIARSVICVSARVEWRQYPDIHADVSICVPVGRAVASRQTSCTCLEPDAN